MGGIKVGALLVTFCYLYLKDQVAKVLDLIINDSFTNSEFYMTAQNPYREITEVGGSLPDILRLR